MVGKALYFAVKHMKGEHFVLDSTREVPAYLQEAMQKLEGGNIGAQIMDIEGCYPNMPKEVIREVAIRAILKEAEKDGMQERC